MRTNENRGRYDRGRLRYPSDLTDEEWAHLASLIPPARRGGNKRHVNERVRPRGAWYRPLFVFGGIFFRTLGTATPATSNRWEI
jgi:hypothetical protein